MKPMKILILTTHLNAGGIATYVTSLARGLTHEDQGVFVASSGGSKEQALEAMQVEHIPLDIRTKCEVSAKVYRALRPVVNCLRENHIQVIHAQTRVTQVVAQLASQITGVPCVTTCHGFFKKRLVRRLMPCWGHAVIAISQAVADHLHKDFGVEEKRIHLVHSGVDVADYPDLSEDIKMVEKRKLSLKTGPVIGIIARLSDVKGHRYLIEAMPRIIQDYGDASLLIAGQGRLEEELRAIVRRMHLENHIVFHPFFSSNADVLPLLDVFVMPSLQEGLGLSVMEAQAAGLPVVASCVGGLPTLVEEGKTGLLVPPGSPERIAQAVLEILRDREKAREMGRTAREFIKNNFSMQQMARETLEVYRKVAG